MGDLWPQRRTWTCSRAARLGEPKIGELVTIIPNHACVVTNLYDRIYAARQGRVETFYEVAARGKVQ